MACASLATNVGSTWSRRVVVELHEVIEVHLLVVDVGGGIRESLTVILNCHVEHAIAFVGSHTCFCHQFWGPVARVIITPFSVILFTAPRVPEFNEACTVAERDELENCEGMTQHETRLVSMRV